MGPALQGPQRSWVRTVPKEANHWEFLGPGRIAVQSSGVRVFLCKVDKAGVGEDGHSYQHQQQAQLLDKG